MTRCKSAKELPAVSSIRRQIFGLARRSAMWNRQTTAASIRRSVCHRRGACEASCGRQPRFVVVSTRPASRTSTTGLLTDWRRSLFADSQRIRSGCRITSVFYTRAAALIRDLALARADGSFRNLLRRLGRGDRD